MISAPRHVTVCVCGVTDALMDQTNCLNRDWDAASRPRCLVVTPVCLDSSFFGCLTITVTTPLVPCHVQCCPFARTGTVHEQFTHNASLLHLVCLNLSDDEFWMSNYNHDHNPGYAVGSESLFPCHCCPFARTGTFTRCHTTVCLNLSNDHTGSTSDAQPAPMFEHRSGCHTRDIVSDERLSILNGYIDLTTTYPVQASK